MVDIIRLAYTCFQKNPFDKKTLSEWIKTDKKKKKSACVWVTSDPSIRVIRYTLNEIQDQITMEIGDREERRSVRK